MKLDIYLNYAGNCQQAFRFYEQHLGGKITLMMTHGQGPNDDKVPAGQKNTILHDRLELGNTVVMGADIPKSEPMRSAYLTLTVDSEKEAERVYFFFQAEDGIRDYKVTGVQTCALPI